MIVIAIFRWPIEDDSYQQAPVGNDNICPNTAERPPVGNENFSPNTSERPPVGNENISSKTTEGPPIGNVHLLDNEDHRHNILPFVIVSPHHLTKLYRSDEIFVLKSKYV